MYFLLANLSFLDVGVCSIAAPKMIYDLFRKRKAISFGGLPNSDLLYSCHWGHRNGAAPLVAFDRYVAICKPLHYLTIMNRMCVLILAAAWVLGLIHSVAQLAFVIDLPFCGPNVLDSFIVTSPDSLSLLAQRPID